jgi:hypothetical protein
MAVYTRFAGNDLQIRFDFLESELDTRFDLYLALDTQPGGTHSLPIDTESGLAWDTLLYLPAAGNPQAYLPGSNPSASISTDQFPVQTGLIPRFMRLPWIDTAVVSLNRVLLGGLDRGFTFQVFITPPGSNVLADTLGPISSSAFPPGQSKVLLAFWNSFPAIRQPRLYAVGMALIPVHTENATGCTCCFNKSADQSSSRFARLKDPGFAFRPGLHWRHAYLAGPG